MQIENDFIPLREICNILPYKNRIIDSLYGNRRKAATVGVILHISKFTGK